MSRAILTSAALAVAVAAAAACTTPADPGPICLDTMSLGPADVSLTTVGSTADLDARYSGCSEYDDDSLFTWFSSSPNVATVSDEGVVTAVGEGTAEIEAVLTEGAAGARFATEPRARVRVMVDLE